MPLHRKCVIILHTHKGMKVLTPNINWPGFDPRSTAALLLKIYVYFEEVPLVERLCSLYLLA